MSSSSCSQMVSRRRGTDAAIMGENARGRGEIRLALGQPIWSFRREGIFGQKPET